MTKVLEIITTGMVSWGGLTTVALNYYRAMDRENIIIDFAADCSEAEPWLIDEIQSNGSKCIALPPRRHIFGYLRKLYQIMKDYDVVHIHGNSATMFLELLPAVMRKVPKRIAHTHTTRPEAKLLNKLFHPLFIRALTHAVAVSQEAGAFLYGRHPFTVLNNAVNVERYSYQSSVRDQVRREWSISEETVVLGHIGKIYAPKNHPFLIQIFAAYHQKVPNSKLVLVGDGVMRGQIEEQVAQMGLKDHVIFMGMRSDTERWLQGMDCFVFPSIYEGFPLSLAEAQANGLHCVISSSIAEKARILDTTQALNLDDGAEKWAETICGSSFARISTETVKTVFQEKNMDIKTEANRLRMLYAD